MDGPLSDGHHFIDQLQISPIQTGFFIYLSVHLSDVHGLEITWDGPVPYCSVLIYNPYRRWEAWRYLTYMQVQSSF